MNRGQKRRKSDQPASAAATKIIQAAVRPDCSAAELGELAQSDPAFALRVLSVVNSPAFSLSRKVDDVRQAVSLIGVRGLRNLALSLVVSDMVPMGEAGRVLLGNSLRRALAARALGIALGERRADGHFTTGLFLESGLLARARDDAAGAAEVAMSPAAHRVVRERADGHVPHPVAGAKLAEEYMLPPETIEAIKHHHDAEMPDAPAAKVAWVAERVAAVFEGGATSAAKEAAISAAGQLGVAEAQVETILKELPAEVSDAAGAFDRDVGEQADLDSLILDANRTLVDLNGQYEALIRKLETVIAEKEQLEQQLRQANAQLEADSLTDSLTGLPNKRALGEALTRDLSRADRESQHLSLVVVDVDHFKKFNDTYGHATGDVVLESVGKMLRDCVRAGDVPARFGGEEFVVVLPNTDPAGAKIVAERMRTRLEQLEVPGPSGALRVTASFGVASVQGPGCGKKQQELFERADAALYEAKRAGRNNVKLAA